MKRAATLLMASMLAFSLVACGGGGSEVQKPTEVSTNATEQSEEKTDEQAAEEQTAEAPEEKAEEKPAKAAEATIEETVLLDDAGVKVTAKSLSSGWMGPEIALLIENNSGKALTFQCRNSSVNGYMCENMMSCDVADGKKANDTLSFSANQLQLSGVESVAEMQFSLHIFDSECWDTYYDSAPITLKTSLAGTYEQAYDDSGDVCYDDGGVKIVVKGLSTEDSWLGPSVIVEVINTSGTDITVQARDVSINGFMISPFFSTDVCAGKRAVNGVTFASSDLEANSIETIESVELSFHVFDMNSWSDIVDTDPVTINF